MDIIGALINSKNNTYNIYQDYLNMAKDILKYEKLSRLPKFNYFYNDGKYNDDLLNLLPNLKQALTLDPHTFSVLYNLLYVITDMDSNFGNKINNQLITLIPKRKRQQLEIMGSADYRINYCDLKDYKNTNHNVLVFSLPDLHNEKSLLLSIMTFNIQRKLIYVYSGHVNNDCNTVSNIKYKPFAYQGVIIKSFSPQGNNDYAFASYNDYQIMIINDSLVYQHDTTHYAHPLTVEERQSLMNVNFEYLAKLIIKYAPKEEK